MACQERNNYNQKCAAALNHGGDHIFLGPTRHNEDKEEIVVNEKGGKQHKVDARYDLIPAKPIDRVAVVLGQGCQRYGKDNWMLIELNDHINHAINHLYKFLSGDRSEDHLTNAICRTLFASYLAHDGDMHGLYCKTEKVGWIGTDEDTFPVDKNTKEVKVCGYKNCRLPMHHSGYCQTS